MQWSICSFAIVNSHHLLVNIVPWSVIIFCSNPSSFHAPCQQSAQTCSAVCFSVLKMKCAIPEYQSTITRIASRPLTGGSFVMWSIATNFQFFCGRCIFARSLLRTSCVFFWHFWQFWTYHSTSFLIPSHVQFSLILNKVAFIPECPASLWSWFSLNISSFFSCRTIFLPSYCHWLFFSSNLATS